MTTNTIRNGTSIEVVIPTGQTLKVVAVSGTYNASVVRGTGIGTTLSSLATGASYGPYAYDSVVRLVSSDASEVDFDVAVTPVVDSDTEPKFAFDSTGAVTGLVGPGGVKIGVGGRQPKPTNTMTRKTFGVSSTSAGSTAYTYCQKEALEAGFDAIRLVYHHHSATTPTLAAIVAATETSKTDTADNLFEPIVGATKYQQKDSTTSAYGWRTVTWAGASTKTLSADGATQRPTLYTSDWIPLQSVARASGEESTLPLVMLRCYVSNAAAQNFTVASANSLMRTLTTDNTGRILQSGAYLGDGVGTISDANRPGSLASSHIPFAIQYRTRARGLSVIAIGDSITQCTPGATDSMSSWVLRACALSSTATKPVSAWNCGSASQSGATFTIAGNDALAVAGPNVVVYSAYTPNDYSSPTAAQMNYYVTQMMGRVQTMIDYCQTNRMALVLWTGIPHSAGLSAAADAVRKSYNDALRAMATTQNVFLFDADAIVTDGASPASMAAPYNLDNIHLSNAGIAAIATGLSVVLNHIHVY